MPALAFPFLLQFINEGAKGGCSYTSTENRTTGTPSDDETNDSSDDSPQISSTWLLACSMIRQMVGEMCKVHGFLLI